MLLPGKNFKDKNFTYFQTSFLKNLGQPCTNWYNMNCTHGIYLHFCFNELVQGCPRFCRKCKKPCFPSQSVNLDVPIIFEKKMSQCKIKKYLENFSLTDPPWPTVHAPHFIWSAKYISSSPFYSNATVCRQGYS